MTFPFEETWWTRTRSNKEAIQNLSAQVTFTKAVLFSVEIRELDLKNKNGVWARIIKNAFAPLFIKSVDFVAGNPPWVNWDSLPEDYRNDTKGLWLKNKLFTLSGTAGRLGGGKKDISMLFVYECIRSYLKPCRNLGLSNAPPL